MGTTTEEEISDGYQVLDRCNGNTANPEGSTQRPCKSSQEPTGLESPSLWQVWLAGHASSKYHEALADKAHSSQNICFHGLREQGSPETQHDEHVHLLEGEVPIWFFYEILQMPQVYMGQRLGIGVSALSRRPITVWHRIILASVFLPNKGIPLNNYKTATCSG